MSVVSMQPTETEINWEISASRKEETFRTFKIENGSEWGGRIPGKSSRRRAGQAEETIAGRKGRHSADVGTPVEVGTDEQCRIEAEERGEKFSALNWNYFYGRLIL